MWKSENPERLTTTDLGQLWLPHRPFCPFLARFVSLHSFGHDYPIISARYLLSNLRSKRTLAAAHTDDCFFFQRFLDSKDDLTSVDSDKFSRIFSEFENLYQKGKLFYESEMFYDQREQIADAEAFLDIANTMLSSVKSQSASGVSPAEFVNALVNGFGQVPLGIDADETAAPVSIKWKDLGLAVCSTVFVSCGCSTM
ncbi:hypothetical protein Bca52824_036408 [Brassica carinata]|uniref:Non-structural maintenance of chromosomes element 4 n=1 Tax=Brassica carinata TaxID=52824 RepID=A0A8X7S5G7_BRACI|nr:hypothetical protein Bca52824_036408 [Brassica carinata]